MCTIIFIHGVHPQLPLVVAANRDELYARPSVSPRVLSRDPTVVAGTDQQAGGTWMGANGAGLIVGLTNQRTYHPAASGRRSRGEIVMAALRAGHPAEVTARLEGVDPGAYNAFNLLYGTAGCLWAAYARPERSRIEIERAPEGIHVLPNDRLGAPGFPKAERAKALAAAWATAPWERLAAGLATTLADHELPARGDVPVPPSESAFSHTQLWQQSAICTHGERYGTRSATILAVAEGRVDHYLYADGPPCRARFRDLTHLVDA